MDFVLPSICIIVSGFAFAGVCWTIWHLIVDDDKPPPANDDDYTDGAGWPQ